MEETQLKQLHPLEIKVLFQYKQGDSIYSEALVNDLQINIGQANQAISWLAQKNLIAETSRKNEVAYEITELGQEWNTNGTPAERLLQLVSQQSCTMGEAIAKLGLEQKEIGSAFGVLSKNDNMKMNEEKQLVVVNDSLPKEVLLCKKLLAIQKEILEHELNSEEVEVINQHAKKRGAGSSPFRKIEREVVVYGITELGTETISQLKQLGISTEQLGTITPQMLKTQSWKGKTFREYNVSLPPNRVSVGRRNSYAEFLQQVKDKLVGLGFEEFDGPLVETEFWNSDALFMPQFHPARNIHDVYYVKEPTHAKEIPEPWLSQVAEAHETGGNTGSAGWKYKFDKDFTKRLILRSQGTVLSAKTLTQAKKPGKYFGILRVFRHDQVDSTHLSDFYQTEGIIIGSDVTIQTLLGLLKVFAEEFADAEEVKYVPGYFPFTEPSIEVHIKHPKIGWMELGGSGIFRPEVTKSLGIDVPVAAWGMGIDRMATMQMGINDIRDLFSKDLDQVILRKGVDI